VRLPCHTTIPPILSTCSMIVDGRVAVRDAKVCRTAGSAYEYDLVR
jgi:hypothetical protein